MASELSTVVQGGVHPPEGAPCPQGPEIPSYNIILPLAQVRGIGVNCQTHPFNIVGVGEITDPYTCGQYSKLVVCESNPNHKQKVRRNCHNWACPTCFKGNVLRAAERASERLKATRAAYAMSGDDIGLYQHITISPEQYDLDLTEETLKDLKATAIKHLHKIGVIGGSIIFHPYRVKAEVKEDLKEILKIQDLQERKGYWDLIRKDILNLGDWRNYVYFSPHFHIVGFFPQIKIKSDDFYSSTGWVYKNITAFSGKPLKSVKGTEYYLLTHAAYIKGRQTVTYFGVSAPNKLKLEVIVTKEDHVCPVCGALMWVHIGFDIDSEGKVHDIGEQCYVHQIKKRDIKYSIRKRRKKGPNKSRAKTSVRRSSP